MKTRPRRSRRALAVAALVLGPAGPGRAADPSVQGAAFSDHDALAVRFAWELPAGAAP